MKNNYDGMVKHIDELIEETDRMQKYCEDVIKDYCTMVFRENFEEIVNCIQWTCFIHEDTNILYFKQFKENVPYYIKKLFEYMRFNPNMKIQCSEGITFVKSMQICLLFDSKEKMVEVSKTIDVHIVE